MASRNSCKYLSVIQRSDQKLWPFRTVILMWRDQTFTSPSSDSTSNLWKTASGNSYKCVSMIEWSYEKLWPFWTVTEGKPTVGSKDMAFQNATLVWCDQTSTSLSSDSITNSWKMASRNYYKNLNAIQQSDQRLWPFWTVTLVWCNQTSASSSSDSTSNPRKTTAGNSCKTLCANQWSDQ